MKKILIMILISLIMFSSCNNDIYTSTDGTWSESVSSDNFLSRDALKYNTDGYDVTVDIFTRYQDEALNNPNVGQAIMFKQAIDYKIKHPDEEVYLTCTSFHFSVYAAVCLDRNSTQFGYMKNLYNSDEEDGFVRISALLVEAAKHGIKVIVVGQIDASPVDGINDMNFEEYFNSRISEESYIEGKLVSDFMIFKKSYWTSYGDKPAADMMHLKAGSVSAYTDKDGEDHKYAIWLSSTNIDGIDKNGINGNNGMQTGVIIAGHPDLYNSIYNYTVLLAEYSRKEDAVEFRDIVRSRNKEQIDLYLAGRASEIDKSEQIAYIGEVFSLYLTPVAGPVDTWNTKYNPFSRYFEELSNSNQGSTLIWNNPKFNTEFFLSDNVVDAINKTFITNANKDNKIYIQLPGYDTSKLSEISNIGFKSLNAHGIAIHSKDLQLSYTKDNSRHNVSIINSLNFHKGALYYQANFILVIDELDTGKTGLFDSFAKMTTIGFNYN